MIAGQSGIERDQPTDMAHQPANRAIGRLGRVDIGKEQAEGITRRCGQHGRPRQVGVADPARPLRAKGQDCQPALPQAGRRADHAARIAAAFKAQHRDPLGAGQPGKV